jgi:hypothetical protein
MIELVRRELLQCLLDPDVDDGDVATMILGNQATADNLAVLHYKLGLDARSGRDTRAGSPRRSLVILGRPI